MANNTRGAGRKKALSNEQIEQARTLHDAGKTVTDLAVEFGVSRQTMSGYLQVEREVLDENRQRVRLFSYWKKLNAMFAEEQAKKCRLRIDYMNGEEITTTILVNFQDEQIYIHNYTDELMLRAFGMIYKPTWEDFQDFLEYRCLPRGRAGIRQALEDMGLDFYNPLAICEKTGGRITDDDMALRFFYYGGEAA